MRYELVDAESLKLLDDPLREGRKLLSYTRFLSWLGKLLMRMGLPIFFSEDLLIRQALFQAYSTVAKKVPKIIELPLTHIIHKFRQIYCQAKHWSDFDSPSVTWMFKRAVVASEEGRTPSENEAEMLCLTPVCSACTGRYDKTL
jgi:hypothetical protein